MNCMKCGRETVDNEVFCAECLAEMEKYPVKPGTLVQLPRRREESSTKKAHSRRKTRSPEEQLKSQRKLIRRLVTALIVAVVLLAVSCYFTVVHLTETDRTFQPGQNYSSVNSTEETVAD